MKVLLTCIFLVSSLSMAGIFSVVPALPAIAEGLDISPAQAAYLIAVFTLGSVLAAPVVGLWMDQHGRRQVLLPSLWLFGLTGLASGLPIGYEGLLLIRLLQGMGAAALGSASVTILTDCFQGAERVRLFGYNMAVTSLGMMLFPLVGGGLAILHWRLPLVLSALAIPVAVFCMAALRYQEPRVEISGRQYYRALFSSLKDWRVQVLSFLNLSVFILFGGAFLSFYPQLTRELWPNGVPLAGLTLQQSVFTGWSMLLFSMTMGLISFRLGLMHQKLGFRRLFGAGFIFYSVAFGGLFSSDTAWLHWLFAMLLGAAHGLTVPSMIGLYTKLAPPNMIGGYVILNGLVFRLGQCVGPVLMAMVFDYWGTPRVFLLAALGVLPLCWLAVNVNWHRQAD